MSEPEDLERRVAHLERELSQGRDEAWLAALDASCARLIATHGDPHRPDELEAMVREHQARWQASWRWVDESCASLREVRRPPSLESRVRGLERVLDEINELLADARRDTARAHQWIGLRRQWDRDPPAASA